MPKPLLRLLPAAACLLPGLLHAAAQLSPPAALSDGRESGSYTVQAGDTLVGIARRHGLTPDELARANALERPDKIIVGNVLRLPVTPPQQAGQFMPVQTTAPAASEPKPFIPAPPQPVAVELSPPTPAKPAAPAQPPVQAKPAAPAQPPVQAKAVVPATAPVQAPAPEPAPAQAKPADPPQVPAAKPQTPPAKAAPSAAAAVEAPRGLPPEPRAKAAAPTEIAAGLAVGSYANPTLGALRVSQTPTGIAVSRENQTIPMRHLLYGVFDGTDGAGGIHGLRLQYDEDGQVRALLYSSASGKDIPFARVKK